jgi:hypothetical protein
MKKTKRSITVKCSDKEIKKSIENFLNDPELKQSILFKFYNLWLDHSIHGKAILDISREIRLAKECGLLE